MKLTLPYLILLLISLLLTSCVTELVEEDTATNELELRANPKSLSDLEYELNRDYTFNNAYTCLTKLESLDFEKTSNLVSPSESNRISTKMASLINSGLRPYAIDVDSERGKIDVFAGDPTCVPDEIAGAPCDWFEDGLEYYQQCNFMPDDVFEPTRWPFVCKPTPPEPENIRYTWDWFEDQVNTYYPKPDNTEYFTDFELIQHVCGSCNPNDYELWHRQQGGTEFWGMPECLSKTDVDLYFCNMYDLIELYKPDGLEFSHCDVNVNGPNNDPLGSPLTHWAVDIYYGTPNYCCECCC